MAIEALKLSTLNAFDTILLQTNNSEYRILLLDPLTGRSLVEGGAYLAEPAEGLVRGSAIPGAEFNDGSLSIGARVEIWAKEQVFITSPIKSIECHSGRSAPALSSS